MSSQWIPLLSRSSAAHAAWGNGVSSDFVEEGLRHAPFRREREDQAGQVRRESGVDGLEPESLPKTNETRVSECKQCLHQIDDSMVV